MLDVAGCSTVETSFCDIYILHKSSLLENPDKY